MPSMQTLPPKHVQVLVVGGGPGGAYTAAVLAREGLDVAVLEAEKFPRYHIGESLLPSMRHHMRFIDADEKIAKFGFHIKPGAAIKFNQFKREAYTDFVILGYENHAWNVKRDDFDELLLNHAREVGVSVHEQTKVNTVTFSDMDSTQPVAVNWTQTPEAGGAPVTGTTTFKYLVDASGRAGIMSTKYLKNRFYTESLKNIAVWAYWKNVGTYGIGSTREGSPWFEALTDESGWAWFIPLHDGTTSVGVVMNQKLYNEKTKRPPGASPFTPAAAANPTESSTIAHYLSNLALSPNLVKLISPASTMVEGSVKSASDFSYSAPEYAGKNFRLVGDAAAFIDPFFSTGIHLALTSGLAAAASICASIKGDCSEDEAARWHTERVSTSYTRFQIVVLSAYKQIRSQSSNVLLDVDEDNFDRSFAFLRPVIQGASDLGKRLSEDELQKSLDFVSGLFNPTLPQDAMASGLTMNLLDPDAPIVDDKTIKALSVNAPTEESEGTYPAQKGMILEQANARRVIHRELVLHTMETENLGGYVLRFERGTLGLSKAM